MNKYELTVVIDGKATSAKKKAVGDKITKLVGVLEGKVGKVEDWGVKDLTFRIKKSDSGVFLHFPLELTGAAAKALMNKVKVEEDIIRYLLVRK